MHQNAALAGALIQHAGSNIDFKRNAVNTLGEFTEMAAAKILAEMKNPEPVGSGFFMDLA